MAEMAKILEKYIKPLEPDENWNRLKTIPESAKVAWQKAENAYDQYQSRLSKIQDLFLLWEKYSTEFEAMGEPHPSEAAEISCSEGNSTSSPQLDRDKLPARVNMSIQTSFLPVDGTFTLYSSDEEEDEEDVECFHSSCNKTTTSNNKLSKKDQLNFNKTINVCKMQRAVDKTLQFADPQNVPNKLNKLTIPVGNDLHVFTDQDAKLYESADFNDKQSITNNYSDREKLLPVVAELNEKNSVCLENTLNDTVSTDILDATCFMSSMLIKQRTVDKDNLDNKSTDQAVDESANQLMLTNDSKSHSDVMSKNQDLTIDEISSENELPLFLGSESLTNTQSMEEIFEVSLEDMDRDKENTTVDRTQLSDLNFTNKLNYTNDSNGFYNPNHTGIHGTMVKKVYDDYLDEEMHYNNPNETLLPTKHKPEVKKVPSHTNSIIESAITQSADSENTETIKVEPKKAVALATSDDTLKSVFDLEESPVKKQQCDTYVVGTSASSIDCTFPLLNKSMVSKQNEDVLIESNLTKENEDVLIESNLPKENENDLKDSNDIMGERASSNDDMKQIPVIDLDHSRKPRDLKEKVPAVDLKTAFCDSESLSVHNNGLDDVPPVFSHSMEFRVEEETSQPVSSCVHEQGDVMEVDVIKAFETKEEIVIKKKKKKTEKKRKRGRLTMPKKHGVFTANCLYNTPVRQVGKRTVVYHHTKKKTPRCSKVSKTGASETLEDEEGGAVKRKNIARECIVALETPVPQKQITLLQSVLNVSDERSNTHSNTQCSECSVDFQVSINAVSIDTATPIENILCKNCVCTLTKRGNLNEFEKTVLQKGRVKKMATKPRVRVNKGKRADIPKNKSCENEKSVSNESKEDVSHARRNLRKRKKQSPQQGSIKSNKNKLNEILDENVKTTKIKSKSADESTSLVRTRSTLKNDTGAVNNNISNIKENGGTLVTSQNKVNVTNTLKSKRRRDRRRIDESKTVTFVDQSHIENIIDNESRIEKVGNIVRRSARLKILVEPSETQLVKTRHVKSTLPQPKECSIEIERNKRKNTSNKTKKTNAKKSNGKAQSLRKSVTADESRVENASSETIKDMTLSSSVENIDETVIQNPNKTGGSTKLVAIKQKLVARKETRNKKSKAVEGIAENGVCFAVPRPFPKEQNGSMNSSTVSVNMTRFSTETTMSYLGRKRKMLFNGNKNCLNSSPPVAGKVHMNSTVNEASRAFAGSMFDLSKLTLPKPDLSVIAAAGRKHDTTYKRTRNISRASVGIPDTLSDYLRKFPSLATTKNAAL